MPGKLTDKPQDLRPGGTLRSGAIQRASGPAKFTPPPMASVILAKFQSPARPAAPPAVMTRPLQAPAVVMPGSIQPKATSAPKFAPPPMASEILSRFHSVGNSVVNRFAALGPPSNAVVRNGSKTGLEQTPQERGLLQAKPGLAGPPPMASVILAKLRGPASSVQASKTGAHGGAAQAKMGSSLASRARTTGMGLSGAPQAYRPGTAGVKPPAFISPQGRGALQRFKLQLPKPGKPAEKGPLLDYNNNQKLDSNKIGGQKLVAKVCADARFTGKEDRVTDRLKQYVSMLPSSGKDAVTLTMDELMLYLYDDIERLQIPINVEEALSPQALLSSTQGLARLANNKQAFPTESQVKFYRTMNLVFFAKMLGVATEGRDIPTIRAALPAVNVNIKDQITAPRELGNHAGDYKYSYGYFKNANEAQVFLEFTFNTKEFFKPENLALPEAPKATSSAGYLKKALGTAYAGKGEYAAASANEGTHADRPGVKSEGPKNYSIGLSAPAMEKFINSAISVTVLEYHIP